MRVEKLGEYLENILKTLDNKYKRINADFLALEDHNYSLDKIPVDNVVEKYITGGGLYRNVFAFRSKKAYSAERLLNLKNIGFFEEFESIIEKDNEGGILPKIDGIQSIRCLNCGTLISTDKSMKTAIFEIQVEIIYEEE